MNIAPSHLAALEGLGYTEAEARFLYIVATHSGYFMTRQFLAFTGAHRGKRTATFGNRLKNNCHVRTEVFPKNGVFHHLFSHRLYRQIERENLRNQRAHEIDFIKGRVGILDFVLANLNVNYLETESEKVKFFCASLNIDQRFLPARLYVGTKSARTSIRYFADKFPMFLDPPSPLVTFTYVHNGVAPFAHFIHHLNCYLPLFRQLSEFRFVYACRADANMDRVTQIFHSLVKIPLESDVSDDLLRYFRVRHSWDQKHYAAVSDADLVFRNQARKKFTGDRFERLYRGWKNNELSDARIRAEIASDNKKRTVEFKTFVLNGLGAEEGRGVPPAATRNVRGLAHHSWRNKMPIVKKAPAIMTCEVKLEETVVELLEDYARFIESDTHHVVNTVLKKVLWRDQDYRKWRAERRASQSADGRTGN